MTLNEIVRCIMLSKSAKPVLIAIEGYGGSGKTTFANKLKDALGESYVVNLDDFIIKEKIAESSWDNGAFDRNCLEEQVLIPFSARKKNLKKVVLSLSL